jgi:competence protein ComEA
MSNDVPPDSTSPILHRREQAVVAAITAIALVSLAIYAWHIGAFDGGLVDIDTAAPLSAEYRVDVNRAAWVELAQLPSVGETLARRIVQWREKHGEIRSIEDLSRVKGLGPKTIAAIEPFLVFGLSDNTDKLNDVPSPPADESDSQAATRSRP